MNTHSDNEYYAERKAIEVILDSYQVEDEVKRHAVIDLYLERVPASNLVKKLIRRYHKLPPNLLFQRDTVLIEIGLFNKERNVRRAKRTRKLASGVTPMATILGDKFIPSSTHSLRINQFLFMLSQRAKRASTCPQPPPEKAMALDLAVTGWCQTTAQLQPPTPSS